MARSEPGLRIRILQRLVAIYIQEHRPEFFFDPLRIVYYIFQNHFDLQLFLHLPAFDTLFQSNLFDSQTRKLLYAFAYPYENKKNLRSSTYRP